MIQQIFAAPKQMDEETGFAFAVQNRLGYEIPAFMDPRLLDQSEPALAQWKARLGQLAGTRAIHGPVYDLNPVSLDPAIQALTEQRYIKTVQLARELECRFVVFHSQWTPLYQAAGVNKEWTQQTVAFWQRFAAEQIRENDTFTLVIENFMESTPDQMRQMADAIDHPNIKLCLDTGHANLFSRASATQWLDVLEHQLVYVHGNNNHGDWDEHRGFKNGSLDMEGFLNHLVHNPYRVTLALEVFHHPELKESLDLAERYLTVQQEQLPEKSFLI